MLTQDTPAEAERMENVALSLKAGVESKLNIAVDKAFPHDVLYQTLAAVSAEYPLIRIELVEAVTTQPPTRVKRDLWSRGGKRTSIHQFETN